jgi:hypothetical protein
MTVLSLEARKQRIQAALDARGPDDERRPFPWKDGTETMDVVDVPLDAVVLNPHSHRIKPYLEAHEEAEIIAADPFGDAAQDLIAETIRTQIENYSTLRENLRTGQRDPGIITREGLLVNANRRAVALRDLNFEYIRVAILPADAGQKEIDQIELRLQVERTFREDYTFSARLLFIHDLVTEHHMSAERIARMLGWAASDDDRELRRGADRVQQHLRMLAIVREVQLRSDRRIPTALFDQKEQSFIELDAAMQQAPDEEAARRLRDMRLVGMLVGHGYSPLRHMDEDFVEEYLYPALAEHEMLGIAADALTTRRAEVGHGPRGLVLLDELSPIGAGRDAGPLLDFLLTGFRDRQVQVPGRDGWSMDLDVLTADLNTVVGRAAEEAQESRRHSNDVTAPLTYMTTAIDKMRRASERLDRAARLAGFDKAKMQYLARRASQLADTIKQQSEGL